jgi:hypothetical protein
MFCTNSAVAKNKQEHARLVHCNAALDTDNEHGKPYWLSLLDVVTILVISTAAVATILAMLSMFFLTGRRAVAWPFLTRTGLVDIMNQKGTEGASKKGDEESVKVLLDKGANVNAQGGQHGKALNAASVRGDEQVVKLLLDKGADVNAQGGPYGNALQAASAGGHEAPGPFQYNNKYQLWFRCEWNPNNGQCYMHVRSAPSALTCERGLRVRPMDAAGMDAAGMDAAGMESHAGQWRQRQRSGWTLQQRTPGGFSWRPRGASKAAARITSHSATLPSIDP